MLQNRQTVTRKALRHALAALTASALLGTGCGLINVNGKPLGGSFASRGSSASSGSSPSPGVSQDPSPSPSPSPSASPVVTRSAAGSSPPGPNAAATPARLCASARPNNDGTLAELDEKVAAGGTTKSTSQWTMPARAFTDALCATQGELFRQRAAVVARKNRWMATFSFDDRDFATLYSYDPNSQSPELETFAGPLGEYGRIHKTSYQSERMDLMDRLGSAASMMARVALVEGCFSVRETTNVPDALDEVLKSHSLLNTILCTRLDIDTRRAWAEIEATKELHEHRRVELRQLVLKAEAAIGAARAKLSALAKQEPGVARLVAIADAEFKQWASPSPRRVALLRQLAAVELASTSHKRSEAIACEDATHAAWVTHIKSLKLPPMRGTDLSETYLTSTLASADGYLAYIALRMCLTSNRSEGRDHDKGRPGLHSDDYLMGLNLERRGPWSSSVVSWTGSDKAIEFDDRRRTLKDLLMSGKLGGYDNHNFVEPQSGVIASVTDVGDAVEVKFKKVRAPRLTCTKMQTTDRIRRISPSGDVTYESYCVATATVMADITARPVRFDKVLARGLAPGLYLVAIDGLPIVATRSPSSEVPVFVLGAKAN